MKEKEIEYEEREVERVYCDECGTEATDDYRVEPREVCPSCADETAVDRVKDLTLATPDEISFGEMLFFSAIFPVVFSIIFFVGPSEDDGPTREDLKMMGMFVLGTAIWVALLLVVLL